MLGIPEKGLSIVRGVLYRLLAWLGRHPLVLIVLPSLWLLVRYHPFWKDVDAVAQLLAAAGVSNILHCPPGYCFLGRVPFGVVGALTQGSAPGIFSEQAPTLLSLQVLVFFQHAGLWASLRYFLFSVSWSDARRGIATVLLASVASFYTFAHTAGSEAMTAVSWLAVFGSGLRILFRPSAKIGWVIYAVALWLAVGSRTVNNVLLLWLPTAVAGLVGYQPLTKSHRSDLTQNLRHGLLAVVVGAGVFGVEKGLVSVLCHRFSTIERSTDGETFSDRIGTLVATLPAEEKAKFRTASLALARSPAVRVAIEAQFEFTSYHLGGYAEIERFLYQEGWRGEELAAEQDRVILEATLCLYRAAPRKFFGLILKEFARTWATSDYRIARAGPFATFQFARSLALVNNGDRPAPFLDLPDPLSMLDAVDADPVICHWENIPLIVWFVMFLLIGIVRRLRRTISRLLFFLALSFVAVGAVADLAACVFAYAQPRYTLPLLIGVFASGCVLLFGSEGKASLNVSPPGETANGRKLIFGAKGAMTNQPKSK
jgi:hypothetical protein